LETVQDRMTVLCHLIAVHEWLKTFILILFRAYKYLPVAVLSLLYRNRNYSFACAHNTDFCLSCCTKLIHFRCSSETSVATQQTTPRHIPEDDTLHNHRCENLKSYKKLPVSHTSASSSPCLQNHVIGRSQSKITVIHAFTLCFSEIHINIVLPSVPSSVVLLVVSFPLKFSDLILV
jgi:hypothetical protein